MAKKFFYFAALFLVFMGFIGGIGCAIYARSYVVAAAVAVLGVVAYPGARELFNKLMDR